MYCRALADTDSDGKMTIGEFSIACKLINLKLRGFEIPKILPPILIASLTAVGGTPTLTPTGHGSMSPMEPLKSIVTHNNLPPARPPMPPQPVVLPQAMVAPMVNAAAIPHTAPGRPAMPPAMMQPHATSMGRTPPSIIPMTHQPSPMVSMQPLISTYAPPVNQPVMGDLTGMGGLDLLGNKITSPVDTIASMVGLPAPPTPPQSGTPSRSMSISDKVPSIDSPGASGQLEWAIKSQSKLKFTQLFNTTDRMRSGFLTGAQARNLMVQTKLPQPILAKIWTLSDMDQDGRLGCEEFVLAMYLCEIAALGDPIPATLPPDLVPPSFRKVVSRHGSLAGISRHSSVSSQGAAPTESDPSAGLPGQSNYSNIV